MGRWKIPSSVVPTDPKTAGSLQYDRLRHAAELALAELEKRVSSTTARDRARKILKRALGAE